MTTSYGPGFDDYLVWQKDEPIVIPQIEHLDAVANIEQILAVPGIDAFIVGPYDLSCSMGIPGQFEHPNFVATMAEIVRKGADLGIPAGLHIVEPDLELLMQRLHEGYRFIAYSADFRILDVGVRAGIEQFKEFEG